MQISRKFGSELTFYHFFGQVVNIVPTSIEEIKVRILLDENHFFFFENNFLNNNFAGEECVDVRGGAEAQPEFGAPRPGND